MMNKLIDTVALVNTAHQFVFEIKDMVTVARISIYVIGSDIKGTVNMTWSEVRSNSVNSLCELLEIRFHDAMLHVLQKKYDPPKPTIKDMIAAIPVFESVDAFVECMNKKDRNRIRAAKKDRDRIRAAKPGECVKVSDVRPPKKKKYPKACQRDCGLRHDRNPAWYDGYDLGLKEGKKQIGATRNMTLSVAVAVGRFNHDNKEYRVERIF